MSAPRCRAFLHPSSHRWAWRLALVLTACGAACLYKPVPLPAQLAAGDVTGVVQGGDGHPLQGARVSVRGSPVRVTVRGDGRFYLRRLPAGVHHLQVSQDANNDGVPELTAEFTVEVKGKSGQPATDRAYVELGTVRLTDASSISGRVQGTPPFGDVLVVVDRTDYHSGVDPVTGAFTLRGMGAGTWTVAASRDHVDAGTRDISLGLEVDLAAGQAFTLADPLVLSPLVDQAVHALTAQVALPPELPELGMAAGVGVTSLTSVTEDEQVLMTNGFTLMEKAGLWTLEVDPGEGFMKTVVPALFLTAEGAALGDVLAYPVPQPFNDCVDFDQDGQCYFGSGIPKCDVECAIPGRSMVEPCLDGEKAWDCDDDADGEADVVEKLGWDGGSPCRCNATGVLNPLDSTCDGDPNRSDRDGDGICDMYDRFPTCRYNRSPCTPP